ncbi:MAG: hypothetical protein WC002_08430 [Candidatus Muiribacteriota bacterium]
MINNFNLKKFFYLIILTSVIFGFTGCSGSSGTSGSLMDDFLGGGGSGGDSNNPGDGNVIVAPVIKPATVSGRILDINTLRPIVGATVKLEGYLTTFTDSDGYYTINNIYIDENNEKAIYKSQITASSPSYQTLTEPITIMQGETINAELRLFRQTAVVSGHVIENNNFISGARVNLGGESTITNALGYFTLTNVPTGNTHLTVFINNILRLSTMSQIKPDFNNLNINLNNNSGEFIEISSLQGNIIDSVTKQILPDMIVTVSGFPSTVSGMYYSGQGDPSSLKGFYSLTSIPTGKRTLTVVDPNGFFYDYTVHLDLNKGINYHDVEMVPKPSAVNKLSNIVGIIRDNQGNLLQDIEINLRVYDSSSINYDLYTYISEPDGWFSFVDIPQGRFILTAIDSRFPREYSDYYDENVNLSDGTIYKIITVNQIEP